MAQDTTNANVLIQEQVSTMLVQPLEAASVMLASGATIFNSSAPLNIPTLTSGFTADFVGENELIPSDQSAAFGEIKLMPSERKSIKTIVRVSNELIRQAVTGVSTTLQARLVNDVRNALDDALLNGDGADNTITGVLNQEGIAEGVLDLTDPDFVLDALATLAASEVNGNYKLIMNGADFTAVRKLKDGNGRHILQAGLADNAPFAIHGVPVVVTNKLKAGTSIIGDMSSLAIVRDLDAQITILNERYADYDQVGIRCVTRYDMGVIRPEGVLILKSAGA